MKIGALFFTAMTFLFPSVWARSEYKILKNYFNPRYLSQYENRYKDPAQFQWISEFSLPTSAFPAEVWTFEGQSEEFSKDIRQAYRFIFRSRGSSAFCDLQFASTLDVARFLGLDQGELSSLLADSPARCLLSELNPEGLTASASRKWLSIFHNDPTYALNSWTSLTNTIVFVPVSLRQETKKRTQWLANVILHELAMSVDALGSISVYEPWLDYVQRLNRELSPVLAKPLQEADVVFANHRVLKDWFSAIRSERFVDRIFRNLSQGSSPLCKIKDFRKIKSHPTYQGIVDYQVFQRFTAAHLLQAEDISLMQSRLDELGPVVALGYLTTMPVLMLDRSEISLCELYSRFTPMKSGNTTMHSGPRPGVGGSGS